MKAPVTASSNVTMIIIGVLPGSRSGLEPMQKQAGNLQVLGPQTASSSEMGRFLELDEYDTHSKIPTDMHTQD